MPFTIRQVDQMFPLFRIVNFNLTIFYRKSYRFLMLSNWQSPMLFYLSLLSALHKISTFYTRNKNVFSYHLKLQFNVHCKLRIAWIMGILSVNEMIRFFFIFFFDIDSLSSTEYELKRKGK